MHGVGGNSRPCLLPGLDKLASVFTVLEEEVVWPDGLLDACIAMIPKAGGDSTPLGQLPSLWSPHR